MTEVRKMEIIRRDRNQVNGIGHKRKSEITESESYKFNIGPGLSG